MVNARARVPSPVPDIGGASTSGVPHMTLTLRLMTMETCHDHSRRDYGVPTLEH